MSAPIPLEEAWERLLKLVAPLGRELVATDNCAGRYLAEPLLARRTQPETDLSAMDGYAVSDAGPWALIGESRAGHPFAGLLEPGQAVAISTGAHCPPGTGAILIAEQARLTGGTVAATETPAEGRHIRRAGFDFATGQTLLAAGTPVGPVQIALARSAGHGSLSVGCRPQVAIVECGDELVADPTDCPPGRLPASNGAMVGAMAAAAGAHVTRIGPVADDRGALTAAFEQASGADLVITTAGASVGPHDLVRPVLVAMGAEVDFWKVAIRPGKPVMLARCAQGLVLGLPGNPVSSFVTAYLFMLPLIRALQGADSPLPRPVMQQLAADLPAGGDRREFMRGCFTYGGVTPLAERDSSALASLALAEMLIDRPALADPAPAGSFVPCYLIGNGAIA